jgi:hypothetical protein
MQAFISESSLDRYRRACAWKASEVAKIACRGATDAIDVAFDNPTPWMRRAFGYTRALNRTGDAVQADLFTKADQSTVRKYGMGDGPQTRRPGEVGLARDRLYVPHWRNLALTQGINRNQYGNLHGGVAARLNREAAGTRAKRRVAGRWGVYKGEIEVGGRSHRLHSPPAPGQGARGQGRAHDHGEPRAPPALLVAIEQATYQPVMQEPYDRAVSRAVAMIPEIMEAELTDAIAHQAAHADRRIR